MENQGFYVPLKEIQHMGKLISIDGRDGTGKTTLTRLLNNELKNKGHNVSITKLPTSRVKRSRMFKLFAHEQRHDIISALALQVFHMSDRLQHTHEFITPNLKAGNTIITDRYMTASLVALLSFNLQTDWFIDLCKNIWKPSLWIYTYSPAEVAIERIRRRPDEKDMKIDIKQFQRTIELELEFAKANNMIILNTSEKSPQECLDLIKERLKYIYKDF